jgi:hypothetical protein
VRPMWARMHQTFLSRAERRLSTRRELPNFGIEVCVKILKARAYGVWAGGRMV